ncbi:MAG: hypothetical protein V4738_13795 [Pseudomonadota bacterium]
MFAAFTRQLLLLCAAVLLLAAAPGAQALTKCNGTIEVLGHSLRLVPHDNAQVTVKAKYAAPDTKPDRIVVVSANAQVHHSRDGEKRTTNFQLLYQFQPNAPRVAEDAKRVDVRWCSVKEPCQIDKIEFNNVSCTEYGK